MKGAYVVSKRRAACIRLLMNPTITDADIDRIAQRVLSLFAERLSGTSAPPIPREVSSMPQPPVLQSRVPKLAYTVDDLAKELGVSRITIYRLDKRGLLKSSRAIRRKIYSHAEVASFLDKTTVGGWSI